MEARTTLTDKQWALIEPVLPGRTGSPGRNGDDNRMSLEGMIWITRTGAPWRDLPREFGNKQFRAVATRYNKLADSYCAMVNLASWIIETRSTRRTAKAPVYKPSERFPAYNTQLALPLAPAA